MKWKKVLVKTILRQDRQVKIKLADDREFTLPASQVKVMSMGDDNFLAEIEVPFALWKAWGFMVDEKPLPPDERPFLEDLRLPVAPYAFKTEPRKYQIDAFNKCSKLKTFALYMEMGLGKSKVVIDIASSRYNAGLIDKCVIFAPVSTKINFIKQIEEHCSVDFNVYNFDEHTTPNNLKYLDFLTKAGLKFIIIGMQSLSAGGKDDRIYNAALKAIDKRTMIVLDESHGFKTPNAKRTVLIKSLGAGAEYKTIMSGTLQTESVKDLYSQYNFLDERILNEKRLATFEKKYVEYDQFNRPYKNKNLDRLAKILDPYTFTLSRIDAGYNIEPFRTERTFKMTKAQTHKYINARDLTLKDALFNRDSEFDMFQLFLKLQQIVCGFYSKQSNEGGVEIVKIFPNPKDNPKYQELLNIVTMYPNEKFVLWCKFIEEIHDVVGLLRNEFGEASVSQFHGGISIKDRQTELDKFVEGDARFFVSNAATGGEGLNGLQVANYAIYLSNTFKYIERVQSEARINRARTTTPTVIDLVALKSDESTTIDRMIIKSILRKEDLVTTYKSEVKSFENSILVA